MVKFDVITFLVFFLLLIFGNVLRETVRYIVASSFDSYQYAFVGEGLYQNKKIKTQLTLIFDANKEAIRAGKDFKDKSMWDELGNEDQKKDAMIELSGRLFTITICFAGLIILFVRRKERKKLFEIIDWAGVVMTLFIMKQVVLSLFFGVLFGMPSRMASMADYFNLNYASVEEATVIVGTLISLFVLFVIVPKQKLLLFTISGFIGAVLGNFVWLRFLVRLLFPKHL